MIERARERRQANGRPTILFLDEIHRFNKAQQDALLPAVEEGLLTLIGATTENPYFEVNSALLSRSPDLRAAAARAGPGRGAAAAGAGRPRARDRRAAAGRRRGAGDARRAQRRRRPGRPLGAGAGGRARPRAKPIDVAAIEDALQRKALDYDRQGDRHYDFVSAWIKATRGSDVDASLYYLAVMLEGGEDPRFIARRMVILASEDIGNADPQALLVADAAARAVDRVGLPECALNLAQAAVHLALAPKSNASYKALARGPRRGPRATAPRPRPTTCATPTTPAPRSSAAASGYRYAHDEPGGVSDQQLLPEGLAGPALLRADRPRLRGRAGPAPGGRCGRDSDSPSDGRNFPRPPGL